MAYCTKDQIKVEGGWATSDTGDDAYFDATIPRAQQRIDSFCNRTFEMATTSDQSDSDVSTARIFDAVQDVRDIYTLMLDKDLSKVVSIKVDGVAVSSDSYVFEPRSDAPYWGITILSNSSDSWEFGTDAENAIEVDGFWTYSTSAPADIEYACIKLCQFYLKMRNSDLSLTAPIVDASAGVTILPVQIPNEIRSILMSYKRTIFEAV